MKTGAFLAGAKSAGWSRRYYRVFAISSNTNGQPGVGLDFVAFFSTLTFITISFLSARADGVGRE